MSGVDTLLLCSCAGSQSVDPGTAAAATGAREARRCDHLCGREIGLAEAALAGGGRTLIACGQQAAQFDALAESLEAGGRLATVDIRDRAGWTAETAAHAKQAALLAEALLPRREAPTRPVVSEGTCLVLGGEAALEAAARLADRLSVTALLDAAPEDLTPDARFDIARGRVRAATGALAGFRVTVDSYAALEPAGRGGARFGAAAEGAESRCDIILDLRGGLPLFPAPHKRDGYVRADPRDPAAVERALFEAADLVGEFEKPLYIDFDAALCAHSRAGQPGCTRCLSVCPTGAITPAGEHVAIDPDICAGCGACAAVCPSGAAAYDAPPVESLFARLSALASAYRAAGGDAPRVLFHDAEHGGEMIRLSARFGRGLPPDAIPVEVPNVEGVGHAELLVALGVGFSEAAILLSPGTERATVEAELAIARAILGGAGREAERLSLLDAAEPDAFEAALRGDTAAPLGIEPILPLGGRRDATRLAARALATGEPAPVKLPEGAPYGAVLVDTEACTLCLACVSICPSGALGDNPDKPQLRFQESACLQCGLCANACPEDAIALAPRLDPSDEALRFRVMKEEEPFDCVSCGKPFGTRSTIARIMARLEGKHWMFTRSGAGRLIQMCDDCRVRAQYDMADSPFRAGERPRVRTSDDDFAARGKPH